MSDDPQTRHCGRWVQLLARDEDAAAPHGTTPFFGAPSSLVSMHCAVRVGLHQCVAAKAPRTQSADASDIHFSYISCLFSDEQGLIEIKY
jgi:hypothetical protein